MAARLYRAFPKILDVREILLGLADDYSILGPLEILDEVVQQQPTIAMSEEGLTSQATKSKIYVQPFARAACTAYFEECPRSSDPSTFSIHDIPDGRLPPAEEHEPFYDPLAGPAWPESDGINIMGTPYG